MNAELIEHELVESIDKTVTVIVPGFGHFSQSFMGVLGCNIETCPVIFYLGGNPSIIFNTNDIHDVTKSLMTPYLKIIRLKGPTQYAHEEIFR